LNHRRWKLKTLNPLRYFLDTHDTARGTFPAGLTPEQFEGFFAKFEACNEEGVTKRPEETAVNKEKLK
jgi:hypothetical protein